ASDPGHASGDSGRTRAGVPRAADPRRVEGRRQELRSIRRARRVIPGIDAALLTTRVRPRRDGPPRERRLAARGHARGQGTTTRPRHHHHVFFKQTHARRAMSFPTWLFRLVACGARAGQRMPPSGSSVCSILVALSSFFFLGASEVEGVWLPPPPP